MEHQIIVTTLQLMASISEHLIGLPIAADGKPAAPLAPTEAGAGAVFGAWCSGSIGPTCFMGPLDVPWFFLLLMPFLLTSSHFHPLKEQPRPKTTCFLFLNFQLKKHLTQLSNGVGL